MKSHFTFTKKQRNGIFLLLLIIVVLQVGYLFVNRPPSQDVLVNQEALEAFTQELDSLRLVQLEESKPKIYPFNPNYITDYKGAQLGMTNEEIDRLLNHRKQNKWINSVEDFQKVTQVSDSLLNALSPYFKFPEWVSNPKPSVLSAYVKQEKTFAEKLDLNKATAAQLKTVNGVGDVLSDRIVKFRNKFPGGFIADIQLEDVYGLTPEVIQRITSEFTVKTPRNFEKINVNTATLEQLVTIQHIDYDLAYRIIEQRQLREGYKSIDELTKVKGFPINKIDIIKLYLSLD
ncbi:ComEA family DNA-binding protein [Aestuariibaculum lutulentum]|uniref:Helix-hairpin-helix domain-containing protein n=1 Tax=Aestuariibaculum lutulentum TaxID=2920935 RepID=A0ABS9REF4_9FLAO|nr:helix-hairpin-helix domain-containing protein [Aestuariibaculum lutulentum]MCH4551320.1 helix-hairpin-helix domain-containing protein [Aestuariibaculum lutulentum]